MPVANLPNDGPRLELPPTYLPVNPIEKVAEWDSSGQKDPNTGPSSLQDNILMLV